MILEGLGWRVPVNSGARRDTIVVRSVLKPVRQPSDLLPAYRGTPIEDLFAFHNFGAVSDPYANPALLIGMCMDHRSRLRIPENFAYVMRTAGANLRGLEFQVSFAIGVGGVQAIALIGHDDCGMQDLMGRRCEMNAGLVERAGWEREAAERHFDELADRFAIPSAAGFIRSQARHLRQQYPEVLVAPLMYRLDGGMLEQLDDPVEGG